MPGFASHIKEAIEINRKRKHYYSKVSNGRTRSLSNILIGLERLSLPLAKYYDLKGKKFNRKGIGIVREDFAEMDLRPVESKPRHEGHINSEIHRAIKQKVSTFLSSTSRSKDLQLISKSSSEFLEMVREEEKQENVHFAMLVHMIESVISIADNGIEYNKISEGKTKSLTLDLVRLHFFSLRFAPLIDRMANPFHQEGIGIIVNDMPDIL